MLISNIVLAIICILLVYYNHKKDKQIESLKMLLNKELLERTFNLMERKTEDDK